MARRTLVARLFRRLRRRRRSSAVATAPQATTPQATTPRATVEPTVDLGPVQRLGDGLWAGLEAMVRPELETLTEDTDVAVAAAAAHELATWAFMHDRVGLATQWAPQLHTDIVEHGVVAALVAERLGDRERAVSLLDVMLAAHPDDPHLGLHRANLEPVAARLDAVTALLANAGCDGIDCAGDIASFGDLPVRPTQLAPTGPVDRTTSPLVTVIVPAFNAASTVAHAVASLQAQTYPHLQIIVVDDASTDATPDVVRELARSDTRISLVRQPSNKGAYAARNAGLDRATGAFVTVHDADDWAHPQRIDRQARHLLSHPDVVANATHLIRVDHDLRVQPHGRHPYKLVGKNTASLMVRRPLFQLVGPWDAGVRGGADFEFVKRLEARFGAPAIAHLLRHAPLTLSLRHTASLTSAPGTGMASLWHVYGARRQYLEAFTTWHRSERFARDLPWTPDRPRPFPAPSALTGVAGVAGLGAGSFVDVVVRGDLSPGASGVSDALAQVVRAAGAGRSLALWHEPHDLGGLSSGLDLAIMRLLADLRARLLSAGEQLRCQNLIRVGRPSTLGEVDLAPQVTVIPF